MHDAGIELSEEDRYALRELGVDPHDLDSDLTKFRDIVDSFFADLEYRIKEGQSDDLFDLALQKLNQQVDDANFQEYPDEVVEIMEPYVDRLMLDDDSYFQQRFKSYLEEYSSQETLEELPDRMSDLDHTIEENALKEEFLFLNAQSHESERSFDISAEELVARYDAFLEKYKGLYEGVIADAPEHYREGAILELERSMAINRSAGLFDDRAAYYMSVKAEFLLPQIEDAKEKINSGELSSEESLILIDKLYNQSDLTKYSEVLGDDVQVYMDNALGYDREFFIRLYESHGGKESDLTGVAEVPVNDVAHDQFEPQPLSSHTLKV